MLANIFYGIVILALIFFVLNIKWKSIAIGILDVILWLTASIGVYNIELPYVYTSQGVIYETTQVIESAWVLSWLFIAFTLISMLMLMLNIFDLLKGRKVDVM